MPIRSFPTPALALGALASVALFTEPASAQKTSGSSATYEVQFDDDAVLAPGASPYGDWFKVRPTAPRAMLLRPRVSFVMEMLGSIEKI